MYHSIKFLPQRECNALLFTAADLGTWNQAGNCSKIAFHKFKTLSKMSITEFPEGTLDTLIDNILNLEKSDDVLRDIVFTLTPNRE